MTQADVWADVRVRAQEQHGAGWSELWEKGESDLWDRGFPSPALADIVAERRDILNPLNSDGSRKRALVPVSCMTISVLLSFSLTTRIPGLW
jgi:hypothetical protein